VSVGALIRRLPRSMRVPAMVLAIPTVLALATAGCEARSDRPRSRGSTITILSGNDERVFTPLRYPAQFLVFLPLVTYDESGEVEGRLARSWEHSADYREWTFHLRTDVRWHDGVSVTAHDIEFTLNLLGRPEVAGYPRIEATVVDDSTVTIRYGQPTDALDWWTVYYPKHLLDELDPGEFWDWEFWLRPVGSGPYRYVRHVPKTMVELEASPSYYAGKPSIERVNLKFAESPRAELLSGSVDAAGVERADLRELAGDPRFRVYDHLFPDMGWVYGLYWNHREPLFQDPAVRRALTLAIDRRGLLQALNLPEDLRVFDVMFTGRQYWRDELPEPLPHDPELAEALLEEAGWRDLDGDGVREQEGREFRFTVTTSPSEQNDKASVYLQQQLRRVGAQMDVQLVEGRLVWERMKSGDFQAALARQNLGSAVARRQLFGEDSWLGYPNPRIPGLLDALEVSIDPVERDLIYGQLSSIFQEDLPATFLYPFVATIVAHRRVRGLESPFRADPVMHMEELWVDDTN